MLRYHVTIGLLHHIYSLFFSVGGASAGQGNTGGKGTADARKCGYFLQYSYFLYSSANMVQDSICTSQTELELLVERATEKYISETTKLMFRHT